MPRSERTRRHIAGIAAVLGLLLAGSAVAAPAPPSNEALTGELDALRQESVAAARTAQQHERALADLDHQITLLDREAAARQRGLDDSRGEQAALLGALERLARDPPGVAVLAPEGPIDRIRSGMLMAAAVPGLQSEAKALTVEIARVAQLRDEATKDKAEAATRREALAQNHELLAHLAQRRAELTGKLTKDDAASEAKIRGLADRAADLADLTKHSDAEIARREKQGPANDPTRPKSLRGLDASHPALSTPVSGALTRHFSTPNEAGDPGQRLAFEGFANGEVVAPFDGRVVYAGPFRDDGLVLIIRHGGLYHSVLAGLGRCDVRIGEWVVAGEPVGVMPETATNQSGMLLTFELRHDGRAIDPEPLLSQAGGDATAE